MEEAGTRTRGEDAAGTNKRHSPLTTHSDSPPTSPDFHPRAPSLPSRLHRRTWEVTCSCTLCQRATATSPFVRHRPSAPHTRHDTDRHRKTDVRELAPTWSLTQPASRAGPGARSLRSPLCMSAMLWCARFSSVCSRSDHERDPRVRRCVREAPGHEHDSYRRAFNARSSPEPMLQELLARG